MATSLSLAKLRIGFSLYSSVFYVLASDALGLEPTIICASKQFDSVWAGGAKHYLEFVCPSWQFKNHSLIIACVMSCLLFHGSARFCHDVNCICFFFFFSYMRAQLFVR